MYVREWTYFGGNHVRRGAVMCMNQVGELAFEAGLNASTKRKDLAAKHARKIRPIFRECIVGGACLETVERAVGVVAGARQRSERTTRRI